MFCFPAKRLTDVLGHMTPSAVDLEIRTIKYQYRFIHFFCVLFMLLQRSAEALQKFMKLVNVELLSGRNFELLETYMSIFLKVTLSIPPYSLLIISHINAFLSNTAEWLPKILNYWLRWRRCS
jgi:hypothetical protein